MGKSIQEDYEAVRDAVLYLYEGVTCTSRTTDTGATEVLLPCKDRGSLSGPPAFISGSVRRAPKGRGVRDEEGRVHTIGVGKGWHERMAKRMLELAGWL